MSDLYYYKLQNIRVVDGDTIDADIDLGFKVSTRQRIRLHRINAPETRLQKKIKNLEDRIHEKNLGLKAKSYLAKICKTNDIYLHSVGSGKYGRVLGELYFDKLDSSELHDTRTCINDLMLSEGIVRPYMS
jgi:micrococcal nuclease